MTRHIAFLRAINVGGHTVEMARLRALFVEMGFTGVATFIASGNVIFEAAGGKPAALERKIEARLQKALGYQVAAFIRAPAEVAAVAECRPFPPANLDAPGNSLYVAFLKAPLGPAARRKVLAHRSPVDDFHVNGREVYWLCRVKSMESDFSGAVLEKTLGLPATFRNVTTVRKLAAKYSGK